MATELRQRALASFGRSVQRVLGLCHVQESTYLAGEVPAPLSPVTLGGVRAFPFADMIQVGEDDVPHDIGVQRPIRAGNRHRRQPSQSPLRERAL
jgi:hypothetical protein